MKVKHNTQRKLAHYAVYAIHDALRDGRLVLRLIQTNHFAVQRPRGAGVPDGSFFFSSNARILLGGTQYTMLVRSPKPPRTVIRGLINWKE